MKSLFNQNNKKSALQCKMFLDDDNNGVTVARFEQIKYPRIQKLRELLESFSWRPQEIDLTKDQRDFKSIEFAEQHSFSSNLFFQTLMDSEQSRVPANLFATITTLPEIEHFCTAWAYTESIHSFSYTHIIRNIYTNPSEEFDKIIDTNEILSRANSINKYYDDLHHCNQYVDVHGYDGKYSKYDQKKKIWKAMMTANILEGIKFYVSFACSWAFAERKLMIGNADVIKLIARDENVHLGFTQYMLRTMPQDDEAFIEIAEETKKECTDMYLEAISEEKEWAKYLFKHGSMLGLNEHILGEYIDWIAKKRIESVGMKLPYSVPASNPLPWTQSWISGKDVQTANQESEALSYLIGSLDKSMEKPDIIHRLKKFAV